MELVKALRQLALDAQRNSSPTGIIMGTVVNAEPLEIETEQKQILSGLQLILSRSVMDYTLEMTVSHSTEDALGLHTHSINNRYPDCGADISPVDLTHSHSYEGKKVFKVHNALKVGEKVILISETGGQRFYCIDRLGGGLNDTFE